MCLTIFNIFTISLKTTMIHNFEVKNYIYLLIILIMFLKQVFCHQMEHQITL